ncbi:hypothetical protein AB0903_09170 [Streptomyces sp. NPDC048389]|uniref:hypothetical protein n=1 Tax=Streptomyces sp. NPDC048389 TaxID=3154622 RepID=UPI0034527A59
MPLSDHGVVRCRRCGARIRWTLTTKNGVRQPVDADPNPQGNLAVTRGVDDILYSRGLTTAHPEPKGQEWRAMPHHATCTGPRPPRRAPRGDTREGVRPQPWRPR